MQKMDPEPSPRKTGSSREWICEIFAVVIVPVIDLATGQPEENHRRVKYGVMTFLSFKINDTNDLKKRTPQVTGTNVEEKEEDCYNLLN